MLIGKLAALSTVLVVIVGCSLPAREPAVPRTDTARALPLGIPNARFFADAGPQAMVDEGYRAFEREEAALAATGRTSGKLPPVSYLAVSGGGDNGALARASSMAGLRPARGRSSRS